MLPRFPALLTSLLLAGPTTAQSHQFDIEYYQ